MSFATMVRPTFSADEVMVGMPFREWLDAANEGARYLWAGNYSSRVAILDCEGREVPSHGGYVDLDRVDNEPPVAYRTPSSLFDYLTTPAEV